MKKIFFAIIMLLLSTEFALTAAPTPQKAACGSFDQVIEFLQGMDYEPLMGANGKKTRYAVWIGQTGFVVVENFNDKKLCILAVGEGEFRSDKDGAFKLLGLNGERA